MSMVIFLIILAVVAVVAMIVGVVMNRGNSEFGGAGGFIVAAIAVLLFGGIFLFGSMTIIDPKHVGVQTKFGKPVDTLDNGFHWVAPWSDVTEFDGTIQNLTLAGEKGDDKEVAVRIDGQGVAWVDVTLQWQIDPEDKKGVMELYANYREPERVDEHYIERNLRAALNDEFATYDPVAGLNEETTKDETAASRSEPALENLQKRLKIGGIKLLNLTVSGIRYDKKTQERIDDAIAADAKLKLAAKEKAIAKLIAEANRELAKSAKDPGTLYLKCLEITKQLIQDGKKLPPGWSCSSSGITPVVPVK